LYVFKLHYVANLKGKNHLKEVKALNLDSKIGRGKRASKEL